MHTHLVGDARQAAARQKAVGPGAFAGDAVHLAGHVACGGRRHATEIEAAGTPVNVGTSLRHRAARATARVHAGSAVAAAAQSLNDGKVEEVRGKTLVWRFIDVQ